MLEFVGEAGFQRDRYRPSKWKASDWFLGLMLRGKNHLFSAKKNTVPVICF
jgi:hypothetical protein